MAKLDSFESELYNMEKAAKVFKNEKIDFDETEFEKVKKDKKDKKDKKVKIEKVR